jgi:hypothetical protein
MPQRGPAGRLQPLQHPALPTPIRSSVAVAPPYDSHPAGVAGRPEPVAADQRTGQQHKRKEPAGVPIPADLQPAEAAQHDSARSTR